MRHETIGRGLRALRHHRRLRQDDLARAARVARSVLGDLEHGRVADHSLGALIRVAASLGAAIRVDLYLPGGDIHRLLDADHAAMQNAWTGILGRHGWLVEAEVTCNNYGERGSIDLLAWHEATRTLLVIEIKTIIADVQDLLSGMDRKLRVARSIARGHGWRSAAMIPMLIVAEGSTVRRRLEAHAALFAYLGLRGRAAATWLRSPSAGAPPSGLLIVTKLPPAHPDGASSAGRQRVRVRRA